MIPNNKILEDDTSLKQKYFNEAFINTPKEKRIIVKVYIWVVGSFKYTKKNYKI